MVGLLLLVALLRLLIVTHKPFLCSSIYAGWAVVFGLLFGGKPLTVLINGAIVFAAALLYFWLVNRTSGIVFWLVVLIGGLALMMF